MKTIKTVDLVNNFKLVCNWLEENSEGWVVISRPKNKNIVLMTEKKANELAKTKRNLAYLTKLEKSIKEAERGEVVEYSMKDHKFLIDGDN